MRVRVWRFHLDCFQLKLKRMMKIIREKKQTKSDFPVRNGERVMKIRAAEVVPVLADLLLPACLLRDSSVTDDERLQLAMLRDVVLAAASSGVFSPIAVKNRIHTILGKDRYNAMVAGNTAQITAIRKAVSELRKVGRAVFSPDHTDCGVCQGERIDEARMLRLQDAMRATLHLRQACLLWSRVSSERLEAAQGRRAFCVENRDVDLKRAVYVHHRQLSVHNRNTLRFCTT